MRIDKFICDTVNITRTQVKNKISKGCVFVNGERVKTASLQIDEKNANVVMDGQTIVYNKFVYIMMNKPAGVISASTDKKAVTAIDLLNQQDKHKDLFVAGRLDKDTTGFLFITNDGELAHNILSPKKHVNKTYLVTLESDIQDNYQSAFKEGVELLDGYKCKSAAFEQVDKNICTLEIVEGKFHQVKRMFEALGNKVVALKRIKMCDIDLDDSLNEGEYRHLHSSEIEQIVNKITKNNR